MKKNKAAGAPDREARSKLRRPFTRAASCVVIAFIILISGAIAFFVYNRLEKELVRRAAEISRAAAAGSAARIEGALMAARADALTLLNLSKAGAERQTGGFFRLHPDFAALVSTSGTRFVNEDFFLEYGLTENLLDNYIAAENELIEYAAAMENSMLLLLGNAAVYTNTPLIALFFREADSAKTDEVIAAFFSSAVFTPLLENTVERIFMVNARDDVLLYAGDVVAERGNYWRNPLVRLMRQTDALETAGVFTREDGDSYIGAFQKLSFAGAAVLCETSKTAALAGLPGVMRESFVFFAAALVLALLFCIILSFSMDQYAAGVLREQKEKIMERCRISGIFRAMPDSQKADFSALEKIPLYGEDKNVTVIFAGVKGFREYVKNLSPHRTLNALNSMLTLMIDSFSKTGGAADKISGDTLTEVWGAPFSEGNPEIDALNAVRGALMLRSAFMGRNGNADGGRDAPLFQTKYPSVYCGVNSGVMIAGMTGSESRCEYTFTGNVVKRARLLEALNKRFGTDILISEYTLALVDKYFITEELPPVKIRGSKKPLRVFAVINVKVTKSGVNQPKPTNLTELRQMLTANS
ncbi:MAG: adenylate/guanylate cyclase domain-containing protein [Spirochaetaceae bacterium]|jgi:adenylate cyclase|nr:adenylate/guanylate cyclase domain-containing protein [Spirochaetaceae bacterium]